MQVTFQGDPIEVKGTQLSVGDKVPNVTLQARNGDAVELYNFIVDKPVVLSIVPDVETRTCELQTKGFAEKLDQEEVIFLTVSRNTYQQFNDWNKEHDLDVVTLSDNNEEFGREFGLEIDLDGNDLLASAVYLIDTDGVIRYAQIVKEVADEPDYDETLEAIRSLS